MKIVFSKRCLEYGFPEHPESSQRVKSSYEFLRDKFKFVKGKKCQKRDLAAVHTEKLIQKVKSGEFFDLDTPTLPNIYEYAMLSAGSAIRAAEIAAGGENAFSLMRPPGHHVGKDFLGGFCYFNNIAIAVEKLKRKTAIIDIDVHHGNGTQNIFFGNKNVLYVSLHQSSIFPGTGIVSNDNCLNYPLNAGTNEKTYLKTLKKALSKIKKFNPEIVAVSAGFDTYKLEKIADIKLEIKTYNKIGKLIIGLKKPTFAVLEGGYSPDLKFCIYNFLKGLETK